MKNRSKIATKNLLDFLSTFFAFLRFLVDFGLQNWDPNYTFFLIHLIWAPMASPGVPKSPLSSNLGGILVDFNDFQVYFWPQILFLVVIVRELRCEFLRGSHRKI